MTDRRRWILVAAVLGSGIVFLDSTVVNVALPRIGRDLPRLWFGVLEGQSYVYNAYLLTLSALLILAGADHRQLRRRGAGAGVRGLGRRLGGDHHPWPGGGRLSGGLDLLARRLPD